MGMKSPAKKKEIVKRSRPTDAELGKIDSNNGDAGKIISDLTAGHKSIEYEARDIALYDIRVNADNEIFRQAVALGHTEYDAAGGGYSAQRPDA